MPPPPSPVSPPATGSAGGHVRSTGRLRQSRGTRFRRLLALCTWLWTACADTPPPLCAAWGQDCGNGDPVRQDAASACAYAFHRLCARKSLDLPGNPQPATVVHSGNLTSNVTCKPGLPESRQPHLAPRCRSRATPACPAAPARQPGSAVRQIGRRGASGPPTVRVCVRLQASGWPGSARQSTSWRPTPWHRITPGRRAQAWKLGWPGSGPWWRNSIPSWPSACPITTLAAAPGTSPAGPARAAARSVRGPGRGGLSLPRPRCRASP